MTDDNDLARLLGGKSTAVHVGVTPEFAARVLSAAAAGGYNHHRVNLAAVSSPADMYALLGQEFAFPSPVINDDGMIDWLSDLEWLGDYPGHIVVFEGLDELRVNSEGSLRGLTWSLPFVLDRMRSGDESFHAVLASQDPRVLEIVSAELKEANDHLAQASLYASPNPSAPVTIVKYGKA